MLRSRDKAIIISFIVFLILSLLDATLTLWGLGQGAIEEVNPVMRWLIEENTIAFMIVKLSLPVMLGFVLWEIRDRSRQLCFLLVVACFGCLLCCDDASWLLDDNIF
ncbi:hypothetical protein DP73_17735 [Desulfosporosinus sp. HMP52]|uniref:DUF5658 family protein n=1 Tax=Desulfosporosinus sp. HMP52 TaxID=1487923 RepID=UPI00051FA381|nr:DUF5658 family protein [Desulfosporosinus sp. HMP52]KGK85872.1 hypothetical protein DP73_17735 [Desulfosporosinus sp. HMP52]